MRAYHFLRADWVAGRGDEPAWKVGEQRAFDGPIRLCQSGYHSSPTWAEALRYAPGPVACVVDVSEPVAVDGNWPAKQVSQYRKLVAGRDCSIELRLFAADCAERALDAREARGRKADPRSRAAVKAARDFAEGRIDKDQMIAAAVAAYDAWADDAYAAAAAYAAAYVAWADDAYAAAYAAWAAAAYDADAYADADAARKTEREWQAKRLAEYLDAALSVNESKE